MVYADDEFIHAVVALVADDSSAAETAVETRFAELFWRRVPAADVQDRDPQDAAAMTRACAQLFHTYNGIEPRIRILNPQQDRDGFTSPHTIVQIVTPDMPFITDSILTSIVQENLATHHLQNAVLYPQRNDAHVLYGFGDESDTKAETLIYAEIDRLAESRLHDLELTLREVLLDVRSMVEDFPHMTARVQELIVELNALGDDVAVESAAFLEWLLANHFVFLGYRDLLFSPQAIKDASPPLGLEKRRPIMFDGTRGTVTERQLEFLAAPELLAFSRSAPRSRVHRSAYPDFIGVKRWDKQRNVIGVRTFLGLYTSPVYSDNPQTIPVLRRKVARILTRTGFEPTSFDGRLVAQVLATHPRAELFQGLEDELLEQIMQIAHIHEKHRVKLMLRRDRSGGFVTALVYIPRDLYRASLAERIQAHLVTALHAYDCDFIPYFSESILVRAQYVLRVDPKQKSVWDIDVLDQQICELARDWEFDLKDALVRQRGELDGLRRAREYRTAFPNAYRDRFDVQDALADIDHIARMDASVGIVMRMYRQRGLDHKHLNLKVFHNGTSLSLYQIMPVLTNLGLDVIGEVPYEVKTANGATTFIQDFHLHYTDNVDLDAVDDIFEETFLRIWNGDLENDSFNKLTLAAQMDWRGILILRAYARYMKQIGFGFSQGFISVTLINHAAIAADLVAYFRARAALDDSGDAEPIKQRLQQRLEAVQLLNEDRVLRRYVELIEATLRTNYFQAERAGDPKTYLALKFDSAAIANLPEPRPAFEVFVYAADVEGVHLRNGRIARGGLRWSDRGEDYRTEVLGLVKAQVVKNAVIVPTGAKGCFYIKGDFVVREDCLAAGLNGYKRFVRGLLDVTDNISAGKVVPPLNVCRHDGDDPYLVVAADKGTATFSDTANEIAASHSFWLDDAFASGGSHGYDHKKLGITARGAWVSVQRHFAEQGIDVQSDAVTAVGIGDMSGDVFGNGLLLSRSVRLVGAFNHLHIFVDPTPDPERSYAERQRLFQTPKSTWLDYNPKHISVGGGVFPRTAKAIRITPPMQDVLGVTQGEMSPDELIRALLRAPADLLWNGGIGTYVKASHETHSDAHDRANDAVRVDAGELRCKVVGEGGNLGFTQAARIEYASYGGAINTDFIDNSGGVDCSDHEVNIKIFLNEEVAVGRLTTSERNELLENMAVEVAELVLANNFRQAQALSLAQRHCAQSPDEYIRFIATLEADGDFDRSQVGLGNEDELVERVAGGQALTRPELAVLLSYAKIRFKEALLAEPQLTGTWVNKSLTSSFPNTLLQRYTNEISKHRLAREIVCTQITNDMIDRIGITFVNQQMGVGGHAPADVVTAYDAAANMFLLRESWAEVVAAPCAEAHKFEMLLELANLGRLATRWLLRWCKPRANIGLFALTHADSIRTFVVDNPQRIMGVATQADWSTRVAELVAAGVAEHTAQRCGAASQLVAVLPVAKVAAEADQSLDTMADTFVTIGESLGFERLIRGVAELPIRGPWQMIERDALLDDLNNHQAALVAYAMALDHCAQEGRGLLSADTPFRQRWDKVMQNAFQAKHQELAVYTMTVRRIAEFVADAKTLIEAGQGRGLKAGRNGTSHAMRASVAGGDKSSSLASLR